jgi:hypothetical protein
MSAKHAIVAIKQGLVVLGLALLTGCASSQVAYLQDGMSGYRVECHGVLGRWSSCRSEAAALCGSDQYRVLSRNHLEGASEAEADQSVRSNAFHTRTLLVQCTHRQLAWRVDNFVRQLPKNG